MSVEALLDTNVLLYAASQAPTDAAKREVALELMGKTRFGLSLQVLQEFFHNAQVKARLGIPPELCDRLMTALLARPLALTDVDLFADARVLCRRYQLSYWDAAVVAAARRLRAPILYTEDLQDGQDIGGVRIVNPFRDRKENLRG